ncbi:MAG: NUDIX hydrolase [Campylobacteraceae bacterium 4484_4]|nr:MAG: NUDIX hydrolase [Campylobacteraceae bacterium 4484_4]
MVEILKIESAEKTRFIKPKIVHYLQDGIPKRWEVVETYDSVAVLLYHKTQKAFVLVKQFRPAVYLKNHDGYTYELCAGLVDKQKPLAVIAKEEILEECGYDVPVSDIETVNTFFTAVGFAGGEQTLFYAEVDEKLKVSEGGGIDEESIEVVYLPVSEAKAFIYDQSKAKTPGLMFAFMWFFERHPV